MNQQNFGFKKKLKHGFGTNLNDPCSSTKSITKLDLIYMMPLELENSIKKALLWLLYLDTKKIKDEVK